MFFINNIPLTNEELIYQLKNYSGLFIVAIIGATPLMSIIISKLKTTKFNKILNILEPIYYLIHHLDDLSAKFGRTSVSMLG